MGLMPLLIPFWVKLVALAGAVFLVVAWDQHRLGTAREEGREEIRKENAVLMAAAVKRAREEERADVARLDKEAKKARKEREKADRDADAARAAGDELRTQLAAALSRRCAAAASAAADGSAPAEPPDDLFERVQRRLDEATEGVARFADAANIAGKACERAYDQPLTP
jgi:hypothetical protein